MKNWKIKTLILLGNSIDDGGIEYIANALKLNNTLTSIRLNSIYYYLSMICLLTMLTQYRQWNWWQWCHTHCWSVESEYNIDWYWFGRWLKHIFVLLLIQRFILILLIRNWNRHWYQPYHWRIESEHYCNFYSAICVWWYVKIKLFNCNFW